MAFIMMMMFFVLLIAFAIAIVVLPILFAVKFIRDVVEEYKKLNLQESSPDSASNPVR